MIQSEDNGFENIQELSSAFTEAQQRVEKGESIQAVHVGTREELLKKKLPQLEVTDPETASKIKYDEGYERIFGDKS